MQGRPARPGESRPTAIDQRGERGLESEQMTHRFIGWPIVAAAVVAALGCQAPAGPAQTNSQTSLPRTPEGRPDLTGIWQVVNTAAWDIQDHLAQKGVPAGQGVVEGNEFRISRGRSPRSRRTSRTALTADPWKRSATCLACRGHVHAVPVSDHPDAERTS